MKIHSVLKNIFIVHKVGREADTVQKDRKNAAAWRKNKAVWRKQTYTNLNKGNLNETEWNGAKKSNKQL